MKKSTQNNPNTVAWRFYVVLAAVVLIYAGLMARTAYIQVIEPDMLKKQGDNRSLRTNTKTVQRGSIVDRNGHELAISVPVETVWADPKIIFDSNALSMDKHWQALADVLGQNVNKLKVRVTKHPRKRFVYIERKVAPAMANYIRELKIPGIHLRKESKRFYPTGEISAHVVGFTNVDDKGIEGVERVYDQLLTGENGEKRYRKDAKGRKIEILSVKEATPPKDITLSIDLRLQYLSYQSLKTTVKQYNARSGSAVILDVKTGEILAMVNQPAFNPNNRRGLKISDYRNRAVTDLFEPGSIVKPFTVASGLKSGKFTVDTVIDTRPGLFKVSGHTIKDFRDYGQIKIDTLIQKSSNIGASKIALALKPDQLWQGFSSFGLAEPTGAYFPGEAMGNLPDPQSWRKLDRAVMAYGYGLATSTLQIARAYMVLANGGILQPVSFIKLDEKPQGRRVFSNDVMADVVTMMESVVKTGGTARQAAVENYTVAGKTGTVKKAVRGGYAEGHYLSLFAGIIPAKNPRLAMVVMVDDPQGDDYYGGLIAAPVFSEVMTGAMRLLNIAPDALPESRLQVAQK